MEVADERRRAAGVQHALLDLGHRLGGLRRVDGDADHLGAGLGQLDALPRRRLDVGRLGHRHALHDDGRAAADLDVADLDGHGVVKAHRRRHPGDHATAAG